MHAVAIPSVEYAAFRGTYRLEDTDLNAAAGTGGIEAEVARLWGLVRRIDAARIMVLHHGDRSWVAAGSLLIDGQKGLNIGFLMPTLRGELAETDADAGPLPDHLPGEDFHKAIWALATRMSRVEVERVYLLDAGDPLPILVRRDGFALPPDRTPGAVRSAVSAAAQAGRAIRYSLAGARDMAWGQVHPIAALLADDLSGADIRIGDDLWPQAIPGTADFADVQLALTLVEALSTLGTSPGCWLQVLGAGSRMIASVTNDAGVWAVRLTPPGVMK